MANMIMFCILAVVILGSAVLCVTTKRIMRAATFLLFVLFGVAGLYFLLDYTFLGAAQISVYGVKCSRVAFGAILSLVGLLTVVLVLLKNKFMFAACQVADVEVPMKDIGMALVGSDKYQYVLPFEFISVFLLACIIGGLAIARKEK